MAVNIGISGFGRVGRSVLRIGIDNPEINFVAINTRTGINKTMAHLLKYDSVHGIFNKEVKAKEGELQVGEKEIKILGITDPAQVPWKELGVDIVLECTGKFNNRDAAGKHLTAGAKKVIISAPAKKPDITIVMGINEDKYDPKNHHVISNASCTTNCLAPVAKVLLENFGIKKGLMTTIHAYTNDQKILDISHKDLRRARAAALSIIPTTTGAAAAVSLVLPELKGKLDGLAIRVPTPNVSLIDLVATLGKEATSEEINAALKNASETTLKGILAYTEEPLVSCDFNDNRFSSIIDALSTMVIEKDMARVLAWYDNEMGYSARIIDLACYVGKKL